MTKKITISVSDELHEKMEEWKDSFNFSGVFQEAIAEEIQRKEDFQKRLKEVTTDMSEIIERLKREKEGSDKEAFVLGNRDGLMWAKAAHITEIESVISAAGEADEIGEPRFSMLLDLTTSLMYCGEPRSEKDAEYLDEYLAERKKEMRSRFLPWGDGWIDGVCAFYEEIEDKL